MSLAFRPERPGAGGQRGRSVDGAADSDDLHGVGAAMCVHLVATGQDHQVTASRDAASFQFRDGAAVDFRRRQFAGIEGPR